MTRKQFLQNIFNIGLSSALIKFFTSAESQQESEKQIDYVNGEISFEPKRGKMLLPTTVTDSTGKVYKTVFTFVDHNPTKFKF